MLPKPTSTSTCTFDGISSIAMARPVVYTSKDAGLLIVDVTSSPNAGLVVLIHTARVAAGRRQKERCGLGRRGSSAVRLQARS